MTSIKCHIKFSLHKNEAKIQRKNQIQCDKVEVIISKLKVWKKPKSVYVSRVKVLKEFTDGLRISKKNLNRPKISPHIKEETAFAGPTYDLRLLGYHGKHITKLPPRQ